MTNHNFVQVDFSQSQPPTSLQNYSQVALKKLSKAALPRSKLLAHKWDRQIFSVFCSLMRMRNKDFFNWWSVINSAAFHAKPLNSIPSFFRITILRGSLNKNLCGLKECNRDSRKVALYLATHYVNWLESKQSTTTDDVFQMVLNFVTMMTKFKHMVMAVRSGDSIMIESMYIEMLPLTVCNKKATQLASERNDFIAHIRIYDCFLWFVSSSSFQ